MVTSIKAIRTKQPKLKLTPWTLSTLLLAGLLLSPIVAVFIAASEDSGGLWTHLFSTVLPRYTINTLVLMVGVGIVSLVFGVTSAWCITRYQFPGRKVLEWLLLLPAAVPTYLIAYTYTDFLEFAGPVQTALRDLMGWESARDYWFPEIRSMGGATLVLGAVLYPYVYMMTRTAFMLTPASYYEVGLLANRSPFFQIALPLARPAIVAGLSLVLMETISEFGAVEYFAIETLTLGIFNVWLGQNNLPAAAQIASAAFLFIIALLSVELLARKKKQFSDTGKKARPSEAKKANLQETLICLTACLTPIIIGFIIPVGVLLNFIIEGYSLELQSEYFSVAVNSIMLATYVALVITGVAALMALVSSYQGGPMLQRVTKLSSIGYAFPGTILAIGVITVGGALDTVIADILKTSFDISYSGWLTGSIGLIVIACAVRFQAVGYGSISSGIEKLPPNMAEASRLLGRTFPQTIMSVVIPSLRLPIITGALLIFVDVMKELPMTLLLRPFNYETLSTFVYQYAKDELLEEAAMPALMIVCAGIIPVMAMNAGLRRLAKRSST